MSRRIVTRTTTPDPNAVGTLSGTEVVQPLDKYSDKLIKDIPADIIGAWLAAKGLILAASNVPTTLILWLSFFAGIVLTFFWTMKQTNEPGKKPAITQCVISSASFAIWAMAMGQPFNFSTLYGSLFLIMFSLVVPLINPPED